MTRAILRVRFFDALNAYEQAYGALVGIARAERRTALVEQLIDSARRTQYFERLLDRPGGPRVADPNTSAFNPLRAAILYERAGQRDEAFWLAFLFVHFGKHRRSGWRLIADIYGRLGDGTLWSWDAVTADVNAFRQWLEGHADTIKSREPRRGFGNHRKYESLGAWNDNGTGAVVASYVNWVAGDHDARIGEITAGIVTPTARFDALYRAVQGVRRFGRTGAFDYCATLSRLRIVAMEPSAACLAGASGPLSGARLLVCEPGQCLAPASLESALAPLREQLGVGFDVLEDALCNWQKSPDQFKPFRG